MTDNTTKRPPRSLTGSPARWVRMSGGVAAVVLAGVLVTSGAASLRSLDALALPAKPQPVVERHPLALPADAAPLQVAAAYLERWDAGDVAGYEALVAPTANLFTQDAAPEVAIESWYRIATGITLERSCALAAPDRVRCETTFVSGLRPGEVIADDEVMVMVIADGQIVEFVFPHGFRPVFDDDSAGLVAYRDWLQASDPREYNSLFLSPETIVVNTAEARAQHQELIASFLEAGG